MNRLPSLLFLFILALAACGSNQSIPVSSQTSKPSLEFRSLKPARWSFYPQDKCEKYWAKQFHLDSIKVEYFNKNVFPVALKNQELTPSNKEFLWALNRYLNNPDSATYNKLTPELILFPIFTLAKNKSGVFGFERYDHDSSITIVTSLETKLLEKTDASNNHYPHEHDEDVTYVKDIFDSLYKNRSRDIYVYTHQGRKKSTLNNFGYHSDECLGYYYYPIDLSVFSANEKILVGSLYSMDLIYENNPEIDSLIQHQFKEQCYDCQESEHLAVTFARLKGIPDLYFIYADTFPINDGLFVPSRSLIMKMKDNSIVHLWHEGLDLFGCSCL